MAYESASFINQLDKNLPRGSDSVSEGDIHLRTIKDVLKNSFPNVDEAVNAVHTRPTEPPRHTAGTVWFDTSSGLIKLRNADNTEWINMAHGASAGLGSLLRRDWFEWAGPASKRNEQWERLSSWVVSPLSSDSSLIISASADVSCWGYSSAQSLRVKLRDVTTDIDITGEQTAIGFEHISDAGNFEPRGQMNLRVRYDNHPAGAFDLGLYCRCTDAEAGGYDIKEVVIQCDEME